MPLSIFLDALPFTLVQKEYLSALGSEAQTSVLVPNVGYSSALHWQLYCNQYPDQTGAFVDWVYSPEKSRAVRVLSRLLAPLDSVEILGVLARKTLDRVVFRRNVFANIPFRFRPCFSQKGRYLFWDENTYRQADVLRGYTVISQDEGHRSYSDALSLLQDEIQRGTTDIFAVFGFTDAIGHLYRRGDAYEAEVAPCMEQLLAAISEYRKRHPREEVLLLSDHGMSTVTDKVCLDLEKHFGKQSKRSYIAYCDSAILCIFTDDGELKDRMRLYLLSREEGHLLTEEERKKYGIASPAFGTLIYNLREGNVFKDNWFGKSVKKPRPQGAGMHGFWPEPSARDQMATVILFSDKRTLSDIYDYPKAYALITQVMQSEKE